MFGLLILVLVSLVVAQPADYVRTLCSSSCGDNSTSCSDCVLGDDCVGATQQLCIPKTWKPSACPRACDSFSETKGCGVGCLALTSCDTTINVCVPNDNPNVCGLNETCVNTTGSACCQPDQVNECIPEHTYEACDDCGVVEKKYKEAVCHLTKILPLWQWVLIVCAGVIVFIGLIVVVCCCCRKKGKGPQSIEDEDWLLDDDNRW